LSNPPNLKDAAWKPLSKKNCKAFLREVVVTGKDFDDALLSHRFHRNTIHETVTLVGPSFVEREASEKRLPGLREDGDPQPLVNVSYQGRGTSAEEWASVGKSRQDLG
jgi:hypothetical protein